MHSGRAIVRADCQVVLVILVLMLALSALPAWAEGVAGEVEKTAPSNAATSPDEESADADASSAAEESAREREAANDLKNEHMLKKGEDFAPSERIVVGRDERAFRKTGTLLETAVGTVALVDQNQLLSRRMAMLEGRRFSESIAYPDRPRRVLRAVETVGKAVGSGRFGGAWGKILIIVLVIALGGFCFVIHRGLLDRKRDREKPLKKKQPRLKVTLTNR